MSLQVSWASVLQWGTQEFSLQKPKQKPDSVIWWENSNLLYVETISCSPPSHLYNIKHRSLNITWIVSCNFCASLYNFSSYHLFIKDENDIDGTEQHDLLKIETLHWLLYDPSQLDEALERANLLIRYYIFFFSSKHNVQF